MWNSFILQKILILDLTRIHYMDQIAAKGFVSWAELKEGKERSHDYSKSPSIYVIAPPDGEYIFSVWKVCYLYNDRK